LASLLIEHRDFNGDSGSMLQRSTKYDAIKLSINYWWSRFKYHLLAYILLNWFMKVLLAGPAYWIC